MKKILLFLVLTIIFFIFTPSTFASDNFSTDYKVKYDIGSNADTLTTIEVTLTNLSDNYYASSYDIEVGFNDLRNLSATESNGKIEPQITKTEKGSKIHIPFNERVVGRGNKLNFAVTFYTNQIAQNLQNVWDVNIPGISKKADLDNFSVSLSYPSFLGNPVYIKPSPSRKLDINGSSINFTGADLGESGISLAFGEFQVYNFNLTYHLRNENLYKARTEIALPPTTNYQDVRLDKIIPNPQTVYIDKDGNWLAEFTLNPSQKIDVTVIGGAKVYITPKKEQQSKSELEPYLKETTYWEVNNAKIKDLAKVLKTPRQIYDYVVKTLSYDFSRVESQSPRLGALGSVNKPDSAVCLEFADLFIAIARAAGIPARSVNGYAYTENSNQRPLSFVQDILHAWPEYYDYEKSSWIMVDPTWGNTTNGVDYFDTLDFDHFTFVKNGIKSSYPVPAGGYKFSDNINAKDVKVSIGEKFTQSNSDLNVKIDIMQNHISGFPITGGVEIKNASGVLSSSEKLYIFSEKLKPSYQELLVSPIPPFGKNTISFKFTSTDILTNESDVIRISLDKKSSYKNIYISPFFFNKWFLTGGVLVVIFIVLIPVAFIGLRRLYIRRLKRQDNIRGESNKPTQESF